MKKVFLTGLVILAVIALAAAYYVLSVLSHLPNVAVLKHYRPAAAAEVLDKDGAVLTQYYDRKFRIWVPIRGLPDIIVKAVTTAEDDTFFEHHGVNYKATWDALVLDVQKRRFARGGSTITQQMIKNVFLSKEKTISRKIREYVLATKAEEILTKRKILEIYLNEVEWGDNIYGIEAASRFYLDKHASELTIAEAALLAGMLPNPHYYNPFKRPNKARDRQERVLFNMQQARLITKEEYESALSSPLGLRQGTGRFDFTALSNGNGRPCYQHALEEMLVDLYGEQALYRGGLTIKTTLDKSLQEELDRWEKSFGSPTAQFPSRITAVEQDGKIRAMICTEGKETELRTKLETPIPALNTYSVSAISPEAVSRAQIVLPSSATAASLTR